MAEGLLLLQCRSCYSVNREYRGWRLGTHNVENIREEPAGPGYEVIRLQL